MGCSEHPNTRPRLCTQQMRRFYLCAIWAYCAAALIACDGKAPRGLATFASDAADPNSDTSLAYVASPVDATSIDGSWYVADAEQDAVIVIGADGKFRHRIGRRGSGPGELRTPTAVGAKGDSIFVADLGNRRLTTFTRDGGFVASRAAPSDCSNSSAARIRAAGETMYVLFKCRLSVSQIELRVVEFRDGNFARTAIADTVRAREPNTSPVAFPLFDVSGDMLALGDGHHPCLKLLRLDSIRSAASFCLNQVGQVRASPEALNRVRSRTRGALDVPDFLPRALAVVLDGDSLFALHPVDDERTEWLVLNIGRPIENPTVVAGPLTARSFFNGRDLLSFAGESGGYLPRIASMRTAR